MEAFIIQFPALVATLLYGAGLMIGGAIMWMVRKAISMLSEQNTATAALAAATTATLARIERKTTSHGSRIRSLEWHAWGKEPPKEEDET